MVKLLLVLLIGLVFESTGVIMLKKGMATVGELKRVNVSEIVRLVKSGATNPQILLGVFFEFLFFVCLMFLLNKSDVSFLWPLTGLSFVFATFAAMIFLDEHPSNARWAGVVFIMLGAALIAYSEHQPKPKSEPTPASSTQSP